MIYAGIQPENWHTWESVIYQNNSWSWVIDYFDPHNRKFVWNQAIEKLQLEFMGWVSHAEDLVDKYLSLHKGRIIITKGGADHNTNIEKIIEAIDAYRPILRRYCDYPTLFVLFITAMIRTISNWRKIMSG